MKHLQLSAKEYATKMCVSFNPRRIYGADMGLCHRLSYPITAYLQRANTSSQKAAIRALRLTDLSLKRSQRSYSQAVQ